MRQLNVMIERELIFSEPLPQLIDIFIRNNRFLKPGSIYGSSFSDHKD